MILRETFARTIPFGEEYIFLMGNHWAFFGFCVLFLLFNRLPENGVSAKQKRSFDGVKTDLCFAFPAAARIHAGFFRQALDFGRLIGGQYQRGGIVDDVHNLPCVAVDG